jgi:hypothetical protein
MADREKRKGKPDRRRYARFSRPNPCTHWGRKRHFSPAAVKLTLQRRTHRWSK